MNNIAVIVLNYNTWEATLKEIDSLYHLFCFQPEEIIVIDNCSSNESYIELSKKANNKFTLLSSKKNRGYAAGNNIGLKYAFEKGYEYAWILNNDVMIQDKELLRKLLCVFQKDSRIAVVNPDIYDVNGRLFNRDSQKPNFFDFTIGMFSYRKKGRKIKNIGGYGYVYRPQGCCMLLDLKKTVEVGFLDENTFLYNEESIFAERLLQKGYFCACCIKTQVVHNHSSTVKSAIKRRKMIQVQMDSFRYYIKYYRHYSFLKRELCCLFYRLKLNLLNL